MHQTQEDDRVRLLGIFNKMMCRHATSELRNKRFNGDPKIDRHRKEIAAKNRINASSQHSPDSSSEICVK